MNKENNILIAEFLSVEKNKNGSYELPQFGNIRIDGEFNTEFQPENLKYHKDWNWIMEVIEKIEKLKSNRFKIEIYYDSCIIYDMVEHSEFISIKSVSKIESTYFAIIEFIKTNSNEQT